MIHTDGTRTIANAEPRVCNDPRHETPCQLPCEACEDECDEATYSIVRHRFQGERETMRTGLTLEEAQAHCQREDTHGDGWFDGYTEEWAVGA